MCLLQNNCQSANIVSCTFTNNTAQQGPVLFLNNSLPNISGSTFDGSTSAGDQLFNNAVTSPPAGTAEGTPSGGGASAEGAPAESSPAGGSGAVINSGR